MDLDGKTPTDLCGISIQEDNKWITLIQNAKEKVKRIFEYGSKIATIVKLAFYFFNSEITCVSDSIILMHFSSSK